MIYNQNKVEILRQRYPEGTRICVDSMDDYCPFESGTCGTVEFVVMQVLSIANSITEERSELFPMWISSIKLIRNRLRPMSKQKKLRKLRILKNLKK